MIDAIAKGSDISEYATVAWTLGMSRFCGFGVQLTMKTTRLCGVMRRALCLALLGVAWPLLAQEIPKKTVSAMTIDERIELAQEMESITNDLLNQKPYFADDPLPIHAKISLDPVLNLVVIDLDERLGPSAVSAEMEELGSAVSNALWHLLGRIDGVTGVTYRFGGLEIEHWFPEDRDDSRKSAGKEGASIQKPVVAISPGHGIYFHSGYKDWRAQREPANGVLEDDMTPILANQLAQSLEHDGTTVHNFRESREVLAHAASGQPWWRLAARYILESKMPEHPEIWHSLPDSTKRDREHDEDIRSRPLYANYLGADAIFHVHTNAEQRGVARGLRAIIHGRSSDIELANRVLCSAKELIQSNPSYKNYPVAATPHVDPTKGENRLAKMPSVIVEVGFHTNPDDAALLLNPEFQGLPMRGIAKGYRLYREDKVCSDFTVNSLPDAVGRVGYDVHLPVSFTGNPVFPIHISQRISNCTDRGCHFKSQSLYSQDAVDRHRVQYLCTRDDLAKGAVEIDVQARDFDGVSARSATYRIACTR